MNASARLAAMVEQAGSSILMVDPQGKITYTNHASRRSLATIRARTGVDPDGCLGRSIDFLHPQGPNYRSALGRPESLPPARSSVTTTSPSPSKPPRSTTVRASTSAP